MLSNAEWMSQFRQQVTARRVPISGILELTSRCNLGCVHCYLGPQKDQWAKRDQELSSERQLEIISEVAAAGCLYLALTGGEPMLHPDFARIYRHARQQGLIVTVLCNGTLVNEPIVELFTEYPPAAVEVSIYGATRATYEAVTRVDGSHARCLRGIRRLVDARLPVRLKTVMLTLNSHEVEDIRQLADGFGVPFRTDGAIFPRLSDGSHDPLRLRVSPEEAVRRELSDPQQVQRWVTYVDTQAGRSPSQSLYRCGAGVTGFYIDPFGQASPCLMTTQHRHSLSGRSFASLWEHELRQLGSKRPRDAEGCHTCEMRAACAGCPAFSYQETGQEDVPPEYVCETTRLRWSTMLRARASGDLPGALSDDVAHGTPETHHGHDGLSEGHDT